MRDFPQYSLDCFEVVNTSLITVYPGAVPEYCRVLASIRKAVVSSLPQQSVGELAKDDVQWVNFLVGVSALTSILISPFRHYHSESITKVRKCHQLTNACCVRIS